MLNKIIPKGCRIAIVGTDRFAKQIANEIILKKIYKLVCLVGSQQAEMDSKDIPVVSFEKATLMRGVAFDFIICVEEMPYENESYFQLWQRGFSEIFIMHKESDTYFDDKGEFSSSALQYFDLQKKPLMRYLETHIVDNCNLNCKGCTHFSNLQKSYCEVDISTLEADFIQISKIFNISVLRLMGGEPLLSQNLAKILKFTRATFPNTKIFLVTNGLLIDRLTKEDYNCLSEYNIDVNITVYKPTELKIDEIERCLQGKGISHYFGDGNLIYNRNQKIQFFHKCLKIEDGSIDINAARKCFNRYCWFLRDGKLSKCAFPLLINKVEKQFSVKFIHGYDDSIDIYTITDGWTVIKKLDAPITFCRNCTSIIENFEWCGNCHEPKLEDYCIIKEQK